jgi:uncharacterized membrane protein YsdA (DUF1294 family)
MKEDMIFLKLIKRILEFLLFSIATVFYAGGAGMVSGLMILAIIGFAIKVTGYLIGVDVNAVLSASIDETYLMCYMLIGGIVGTIWGFALLRH